jgi:hypothetical protein
MPDQPDQTQALALFLDDLGLSESEYETTVQSGRSPTGRLRNFGAMNNDKLFTVLQQLEVENNDPEALAVIRAEVSKR